MTVEALQQQLKEIADAFWMFKLDQEYKDAVWLTKRAWQERGEDNVDATHPLVLDLYMPPKTTKIYKAFLRFRLKNFRSYGTGAASGGGTTTSNGGGTTVDAGSTVQTSSGTSTVHRHYWGGTNTQGPQNTGPYPDNHYHYIPSNLLTGISDTDHTHDVTIPPHSHIIPNHNHSVGSHTHDLVHGIYEGTAAAGVTVTINGVDRTADLGGGTGFSVDQDELDIAKYLIASGWNTVQLGSTQLGRIHATIFVEVYLP